MYGNRPPETAAPKPHAKIGRSGRSGSDASAMDPSEDDAFRSLMLEPLVMKFAATVVREPLF